MRLAFRPLSYAARSSSGAEVEVVAAADELLAPFGSPLAVAAGAELSVAIDLDLVRSLSGDPLAGPIAFDPRGSAAATAAPMALDEFDALVVARDVGTGALTLAPFADGERSVLLDPFATALEPAALLVDREGFLFDQVPFYYTLLVPGLSIVHVQADLLPADSSPIPLSASCIELEDQDGGASATFPVALDGRVVGLVPGISFQLAIREVERGAIFAGPVLAGLPDPATARVSFDARTLVLAEGLSLVASDALAVGQDVKVRCASFSAEPFFASRLSILELVPRASGRIASVAGLPERFELTLPEGAPLLRAGLVASSATPVDVELSESPITLETAGEPALRPEVLVRGLGATVQGSLAGPPESPSLAAQRVKIRAGRLLGATVTGTVGEAAGFTTAGGSIEDSFGDDVLPGPQRVLLDPRAVFLGDARSRAELFALLEGLGEGQMLEVEVEGIARGMRGDVRAFTVVSRVR